MDSNTRKQTPPTFKTTPLGRSKSESISRVTRPKMTVHNTTSPITVPATPIIFNPLYYYYLFYRLALLYNPNKLFFMIQRLSCIIRSMKNLVNNPIKFAFEEMKKSLYTALVGHVLAFNPQNQRAQVQVGVQRVDIDGSTHNPPAIIDVPVLFIGGSHLLEFEVNPMDEGLVVFLQRNIDGWKQTGGVANNPTPRIISGQDAIFIHGVRSLPQAISGFANDGIKLRNKGGNHFVWLKNDGTIISDNEKSTVEQKPNGDVTIKNDTVTHEIKSSGEVSIKNGAGIFIMDAGGTVTINGMTIPPVGQGSASYDGTIKAQEVETNSGIQLGTHTHSGVEPGGGNTGGPQ